MSTNLRNKVALVTGGAGAFGQAIAARLRGDGAQVLATDLRADADIWAHDVTSAESWDAAVAETVQQFGRLDILVNNAGFANLPEPQDPENVTISHWQAVQSVNVEGVLLGCQAGIRAMKGQGGVIVNIASISALRPSPKMAAYGASKAAVRHLTGSVAAYCAQQGYNIRCNAVLPGWFPTPMTRQARTPEELMRQERAIPAGRFGTVEELASAVAYLCSDEASYINGTRLVVDGGITME